MPGRLSMYLDHLSGQFHWALVAAAGAGFAWLLARDRAAAAMLGFLYCGFLFYALEYDIDDVQYHFIPTYMILALFATTGLAALWRKLGALTEGDSEVRRVVLAGFAALALAVALWGLGETYREVDRSDDYRGRETIELVAREVPEGAVVIQHRSPLSYMQLVEGRRKDILPWRFSGSLERKVAFAYSANPNRPVYALVPEDFPTASARLQRLEESGYRLIPVEEDKLYRIVPEGTRGV